MRDNMKIVKSIEESSLFVGCEIMENKTKGQKYGFLTLGASLLGKLLAGKGVLRAGEGTIRAGKDF